MLVMIKGAGEDGSELGGDEKSDGSRDEHLHRRCAETFSVQNGDGLIPIADGRAGHTFRGTVQTFVTDRRVRSAYLAAQPDHGIDTLSHSK